MAELSLLIKNNLKMFVGNIQNKTKKKSFTSAVALLVLGFLGLVAVYTLQAKSMFDGLGKELGLYDLCLFHAIMISLSVVLIIGVMRVADKQKTNDTDLLLSLPIKKINVVISKLVTRYVFDFFFVLLLFVPYLVLYLVYTTFSVRTLLLGIAFLFLLPLLSVGISNICSFIVTRIFNRSKYSGLFKSIFSLILFVIIMGLMLIKTFAYGTVDMSNMQAYFEDRIVSYTFLKAILNADLASILIGLGIIIIPFILGVFLYYKTFGKTYSTFTSKDTKLKFSNGKSCFGSMFKKELNYYCNTPAYIINTIIGPIMCLGLSIVVLCSSSNSLIGLLSFLLSQETAFAISTIILCGGCALTTISASSISLEGKSFWILKSSPVNEKTLFNSKVFLNFIIVEPFILIASVLFTIAFKLSVLQLILSFVIATVFCLIISVGGLFLNILLPKLKWDNETTVVKQGLPVLLTMIFGMLLCVMPVGIYKLFTSLNILGVAFVSLCVYLAILSLLCLLLYTVGVKKFRKI